MAARRPWTAMNRRGPVESVLHDTSANARSAVAWVCAPNQLGQAISVNKNRTATFVWALSVCIVNAVFVISDAGKSSIVLHRSQHREAIAKTRRARWSPTTVFPFAWTPIIQRALMQVGYRC